MTNNIESLLSQYEQKEYSFNDVHLSPLYKNIKEKIKWSMYIDLSNINDIKNKLDKIEKHLAFYVY